MTAGELLKLIESEGGRLSLLASGDLEWHRVSPELLTQAQTLKPALVAALQEREKPKTWNRLIPLADLIAAQEKFERERTAARMAEFAAMTANRERNEREQVQQAQFVYQPRTPEQWEARSSRHSEKARILLEAARDFPHATAKEFAEAAEMSTSWVRRTLKRAGIVPPRAPRHRKETQP
jgi:hypothetical protein